MPDFEAVVRQRLGALGLPPECEREVIAELASHLEDCYSNRLAAGCDASASLDATLASLSNHRALRTAIVREKENNMIARHKILGPGMVALLLSGFAQWVIYISIHRPTTVWWYDGFAMTVQFPWIGSLLAVGAITAWLGRKVGARPAHRAFAAIFPALIPAGLAAIGLMVQLVIVHGPVPFKAFLLVLAGWSVLPAIAGALGALPFLRGDHRRDPKPTAAIA